MRLRSSLPHPPGFLYALPLINLFVLMLMCYVFGSSLQVKTGLSVELPASAFQLERVREAAVITMTGGGRGQMYLDQALVNFAELEQRLDVLAEEGAAEGNSIVIMADRMVNSASLRDVAEACVRKGFRVALAGGREMGEREQLPEKP